MRRNDYDVTDKIRTTDPDEVVHEVMRLYHGLYPTGKSRPMERAFADVTLMYRGKHPGYYPCDTEYHDIQHILEVTLAMARLLDGYERGRQGEASLPPDCFSLGVITALFHDCGYLRRRHDHRHRFGGEYTLTHVSRGSHFLRDYLPTIGMKRYAATAALLVHFTGYERQPDSIRLDDPLLRRVGEILGSADIIAQMSDRCYLEKCRDRLYPEFVLGGLARRRQPDGSTVTLYESGNDLVRKTPMFYVNATKRLEQQLHGAYRYAERHFGNHRNPYVEQMDKNVNYAGIMAEIMSDASPAGGLLRRCPPSTVRSNLRA